jgi:hypothetical protein
LSRLGAAGAEEIVGEALYIWSIGTNDFIENYYNLPQRRMQYPTAAGYAAYLLALTEAAVREVHALGGRKMDFTGLTPMGCLPAERLGNRDDPGQCNEEYNAVARSFNAELRGKLVPTLNRELAGLRLVYADTYDLFAAVVAKPGDYGTCSPACCMQSPADPRVGVSHSVSELLGCINTHAVRSLRLMADCAAATRCTAWAPHALFRLHTAPAARTVAALMQCINVVQTFSSLAPYTFRSHHVRRSELPCIAHSHRHRHPFRF